MAKARVEIKCRKCGETQKGKTMKIRIYQIDRDMDKKGVMFCGYKFTLRVSGEIDKSIYKKVFDGEVECGDLEDVFTMFNSYARPEYFEHSLSVSDVVEICDDSALQPKGYYFCSSIGWIRLEDWEKGKGEAR